jgi:hypothetical protein
MVENSNIRPETSGRTEVDGGLIGPLALGDIDEPLLLQGLEYWRQSCGTRKFPAREDISPRGLKALTRNVILSGVIDGGRDYEYRVIGDVHVLVHGQTVQGKRWSELPTTDNIIAQRRKCQYDEVVLTGKPNAISGFLTRHFLSFGATEKDDLIFCQSICLPLGTDDGQVDYLLTFTVYG